MPSQAASCHFISSKHFHSPSVRAFCLRRCQLFPQCSSLLNPAVVCSCAAASPPAAVVTSCMMERHCSMQSIPLPAPMQIHCPFTFPGHRCTTKLLQCLLPLLCHLFALALSRPMLPFPALWLCGPEPPGVFNLAWLPDFPLMYPGRGRQHTSNLAAIVVLGT